MNKLRLLLLFYFMGVSGLFAQLDFDTYPMNLQPNGDVYCQKMVGNTLYLGGDFTSFSYKTGPLAGINTLSGGAINLNLPEISGIVNTIVEDGTGGYLIGGEFTSVGGIARANFVRLNSNFTLHSLNLNFNGSVRDIFVVSGRAYVFGNFTSVSGYTRILGAAIDLSTNQVLPWTTGISSGTYNDGDMALGQAFIGGVFMQNNVRRNLIQFDLSNQGARNTMFNPSIVFGTATNNSAVVSTVKVVNNRVYFGGTFSTVNGTPRTHLAAFDIMGNMAMLNAVSVNLNSNVTALEWINNFLFVAGAFTTVDGQSRARLFAYNTSSFKVLQTWTPNPNNTINKMGVLSGSRLWVSGLFNNISNQARTYFASFVVNSPTSAPFLDPNLNPSPNNEVRSMLLVGNNILAGGIFSAIGSIARNYAAAINLSTGTLTSFAPNLNGAVNAIESYQSIILLGGDFTTLNGATSQYFGAVSTSNGSTVNLFRINFNNSIFSMAMVGSSLYVGGKFTTATALNQTTLARQSLAGFSLASGAAIPLTGFNANLANTYATTEVHSLKYYNNLLYVGGRFSSPRVSLLALNPSTGSSGSFYLDVRSPSSSTFITDFQFTNDGRIFIGGNITALSLKNTNTTIQNTNGYYFVDAGTGDFRQSVTGISGKITSNIVAGSAQDFYFTAFSKLNRLSYTSTSTSNSQIMDLSRTTAGSIFLNRIPNTLKFIYSGCRLPNAFNAIGTGSTAITAYGGGNTYQGKIGGVTLIPPSEPTTGPSTINFTSITLNSASASFNTGNGTHRIVLMKEGSAITSAPTNLYSYTANSSYGSGSNIGGAFVMYQGTGTGTGFTNLKSNTLYYVKVFEFNGFGFLPVYQTSTFASGSFTTQAFLPPTNPALNLNITNISNISMQVNWTNGNGGRRMVVASKGSVVAGLPISNGQYFASSIFGSGSNLGNESYVVYDGTGSSVFVSNLLPGTEYTFTVIEYNQYQGLLNAYLLTNRPITTAITTIMAPKPTQHATNLNVTNLAGGSVNLSWTIGNGGYRMVLLALGTGNSMNSVDAVDGITYTPNGNLISSSPLASSVNVAKSENGIFGNYSYRVVYNGTGNNCLVSNLSFSTNYHFIVVEYNSFGTGTHSYLVSPSLPANRSFVSPSLVNAPTNQASGVKIISSDMKQIVRWTPGNGTGRIVVCKKGSPIAFVPVNNASYTPNSDYSQGAVLPDGSKVVYNGNGSNVLVQGLEPYTDYYYAVFEYNAAYSAFSNQYEVKYLGSNLGNGLGKTQPPSWPRYGGGAERDAAGGVVTDANGNVFIAGTFNSTSYWGVTEAVAQENDIFVAKYSASGQLLWLKTAGGSGGDAASSLAMDAQGNLFVVGSFRSVADFDNLSVNSAGTDDAFIAKYAPNGDVLWVKSFGGGDQDVAFAVAVDNLGNPVVTGYFQQTALFSGTQTTLSSAGATDVWVAKFSSANGSLVWANSGGGSNYDYAFSIACDQNGGVALTGGYKLTASFGNQSLNASGSSSDLFVTKLNSNGTYLWAVTGGSQGEDVGYGITSDENGNFYIAGMFSQTASFGNNSLNSSGVTDGLIFQINGNGTYGWATKVGGLGQDAFRGIHYGNDGKLYAVGSFADAVSVGNTTLNSLGNLDIMVAVYSTLGNGLDAKRFGGNLDDEGRGITMRNATNVFFTGYFNGIANFSGFDVQSNYNSNAMPDWDFFVHNAMISSNAPSLTTDLVAWYKLNGDINDYSGNNFNGTPTGSPVFVNDRNNQSTSSLSVSGGSGFTFGTGNQQTLASLGELSASVHVNISSLNNPDYFSCIAFNNQASTANFSFGFFVGNNGEVVVIVYDALGNTIASYWSAQNLVFTNTWTHLAFSFKAGQSVWLYKDGFLVGNDVAQSTSIDLTSKAFTVGFSNQPNSIQRMSGVIDDLRIYKRALSQTDIQQIINQPSSASKASGNGVAKGKGTLVDKAVLWPNPSSGSFEISYELPSDCEVTYRLLDISGKEVSTFGSSIHEKGIVQKSFNLGELQQGYYFLELKSGDTLLSTFKVAISH